MDELIERAKVFRKSRLPRGRDGLLLSTEQSDRLSADFAAEVSAEVVKSERARIVEDLNRKVLHDSEDAVDIVVALEDYIEELRGKNENERFGLD
jgi:hypothetical protein